MHRLFKATSPSVLKNLQSVILNELKIKDTPCYYFSLKKNRTEK